MAEVVEEPTDAENYILCVELTYHECGCASVGNQLVRHESEQPVAITWTLEYSLPGDLYQTFAAAVA